LKRTWTDSFLPDAPERQHISSDNAHRGSRWSAALIIPHIAVRRDTFVEAVAALNEHALRVKLYQDDALQRMPLLVDM
jgi:hypothetical protein